MRWLPVQPDAFTLLAGIASFAGVLISVLVLIVAGRVRREVARVRRTFVARVRSEEILEQLRSDLVQLIRAMNSENGQRQRELARRIAARLEVIDSHIGAELGGRGIALATTFSEAARSADPAIMKVQLLNARGTLEAFLVGVESRLRDQHVAGEP